MIQPKTNAPPKPQSIDQPKDYIVANSTAPTEQPALLPGMHVRIPFDLAELPGEYRDYRIGQLKEINHIASSALIQLQTYSPDSQLHKK